MHTISTRPVILRKLSCGFLQLSWAELTVRVVVVAEVGLELLLPFSSPLKV